MDMGGWMDGFLWVDNRWMNGWMVEEPLSSKCAVFSISCILDERSMAGSELG